MAHYICLYGHHDEMSNLRGDLGQHGIIVSFPLMSETWHELCLDFAGLSAFLCLLVLASALQRGPQLDRIQFWVQKGFKVPGLGFRV